jgi:hypothetical protein
LVVVVVALLMQLQMDCLVVLVEAAHMVWVLVLQVVALLGKEILEV